MPQSSSMAVIPWSTAPMSVTSNVLTFVSPPVSSANVVAETVARSTLRPWITTRAPAWSRPFARAKPIPRLEPVTKPTRPLRSNRFTLGASTLAWAASGTSVARRRFVAYSGSLDARTGGMSGSLVTATSFDSDVLLNPANAVESARSEPEIRRKAINLLDRVQLAERTFSSMGRRTNGLDRCSTADRSSATIEETNSSLA